MSETRFSLTIHEETCFSGSSWGHNTKIIFWVGFNTEDGSISVRDVFAHSDKAKSAQISELLAKAVETLTTTL